MTGSGTAGLKGPRKIVAAIGSSTALVVVQLLLDGPAMARHIADQTHVSASAAYLQLHRLQAAGVVTSGSSLPRIYELDPDALSYAARWLSTFAQKVVV